MMERGGWWASLGKRGQAKNRDKIIDRKEKERITGRNGTKHPNGI